jgi:formate--tetrahydrofolate ligase
LPTVVAVNRMPADTETELALVESGCAKLGVKAVRSEVWSRGGVGGAALAEEVARLCERKSDMRFAYELDWPVEEKLAAVAEKVYRADGVRLLPAARAQMERLERLGFGGLPVCMAKTQYSFSDDASLLGAPEGFLITIRNLRVSAGAGFIVALTGDIMTMPGLPGSPAAERIDVDEEGRISGLF